MNADDLIERAKDVFSIKRVFGEPIEKDGVIVIPAALVVGGGGGGGGTSEGQDGGGGGFALVARPIGVYVIKNGDVRFQPAIDIASIVFGVLLLLRSALRRRGKRR